MMDFFENLTVGQLILLGCVPFLAGLLLGFVIALVKYARYENLCLQRWYRWALAKEHSFSSGIIISYMVTFIAGFIFCIIESWNTPL